MIQKTHMEEALDFHAMGKPGKFEITPLKPLNTQRDLSLAYTPGVGAPCLKIAENPDCAYDYTTKGNMVAVISNGTAVLGLGNLGALASKPVMEGKAVLFKRFSDIDAIDLEVNTENVDEFVNSIRYLGASFGGINLEDIKAPECFLIEQRLKELLDIPVFHDDQHGTAICVLAALINALELTGRTLETAKLVINGAGAAAIACANLIKSMGMPHDHLMMVDTQGVLYKGRPGPMNQWKEMHAIDTLARTLADAVAGADILIGLSKKGVFTPALIQTMAPNPIVFALANPEPEILPPDVKDIIPNIIMATGRSDFPNQVNNVLGFPYIFRGALDVRATHINEEMKIAAAKALALLAREEVPEEVSVAYSNRKIKFGPHYILPLPFDPRLLVEIPMAVAKAAVASGVARKPITDFVTYGNTLRARQDVTYSCLVSLYAKAKIAQKKIVFTQGEDERMIRAAYAFYNEGLGQSILIGDPQKITAKIAELGITLQNAIAIHSPISQNMDNAVYGAQMIQQGQADGMVAGLNSDYLTEYENIRSVINAVPHKTVFGLSLLVGKDNHTLFIADTSINETLTADMMVNIAVQSANEAHNLGHIPRIAFLSHSNLRSCATDSSQKICHVLDQLENLKNQSKIDFEFEGNITVEAALYPNDLNSSSSQNRLTGPANILIMPDLNSAHISSHLLQEIGKSTLIGPILLGLEKPVEIAPPTATVSDLVTLAVMVSRDNV